MERAEELLAKFTVRTAALLSELLVREPVMAIPVKGKTSAWVPGS